MVRKTIGDWFREESALLRKEYGLDDTSQIELPLEKSKMWKHFCITEETEIEVGMDSFSNDNSPSIISIW